MVDHPAPYVPPDPLASPLKDGEKLLVAMKKNSASDLILTGSARPRFKIRGTWHDVGNRPLKDDEFLRIAADFFTAADLQRLTSGHDAMTHYAVEGYGGFLVRGHTRDGKPAVSVVNA